MKCFLLTYVFAALIAGTASTPEYSIQAIRYATAPGLPVSMLVIGAPQDDKIDAAMVVWLIRGGGRTILFDSGFHRDTFIKDFPMKDYLRPDEAVRLAGVTPEEVTDIVINHAHWDHLGGIDLFPKANAAVVPAGLPCVHGVVAIFVLLNPNRPGRRQGISAIEH